MRLSPGLRFGEEGAGAFCLLSWSIWTSLVASVREHCGVPTDLRILNPAPRDSDAAWEDNTLRKCVRKGDSF